MLRFTIGTVLAADVEAAVNTVTTVGLAGKRVALMLGGRQRRGSRFHHEYPSSDERIS